FAFDTGEPELVAIVGNVLNTQPARYTINWRMFGLFGGFHDEVDRSGFADKSAAALRREEQAKTNFTALKAKIEAAPPTTSTTYSLLTPNIHLTSACWK
ncbi:hypothetical protein HK098_006293, partial [Nowakowskiella sp. JEL0407]